MPFLLITFLFVSSALQAFDLFEHFPEPTQHQTEQYYKDKANNPERYFFNPLQTGNKWYYSGYYADSDGDHQIEHFLDREVLADSLIDGIMHYYVYSSYTFENFWECNYGDSLMTWGDVFFNPPYSDELFWVFSPGASFIPYWTGGWEISCEPCGLIDLFGQTVMTVSYTRTSIFSIWAEGFGPIYHSFDFGEVWLDGCVINGVTYGNTAVEDDLIPQVSDIEIVCFPNPFRESANISFSVADEGKTTLSFYNLRGQKVRTLIDGDLPEGKHSLTWDGRNEKNQKVSSGIYLVRVEQNGKSTSRKVVHLK
jgi:hypothetical protein